MMWIVRLALRRTYTFVVMALLIAAVSMVSIQRMSTDIFPEINIPVVSVVWQYTGMPADEIEQRIILVNERVLTTSVNDIEHIESQSLFGVGVIRIYFYPHAKIEAAVAQVTATSQAILKVMPPGIDPPYIVQYSATSVPIVQIAVSSDTLTEQQLFDYAANFIIQRLGTVQGARVPQPWGGKWPQVMVDLDPEQLYARGLSPQDVQTAINSQNLIVPAGTAKIGDIEYYVKLNSSPLLIAAFNDMPIKSVNGVPIYMKDVGHVRMGYQVQTNVVRRDGRRAVLMTILKSEGASSLDVVNRVRAAMPGIQAQMPPELKMDFLFDQSIFVRAAVEGVVKEGAIAAGLTALMILLFLGSWRSTLIVATSIPLSILTSVIVLWALGQSLNTMTLGGLALAVGILVDSLQAELPRGSTFAIRGQVQSMNDSFSGLAYGLLFAVLLVYFLMVVNFQSWLDPFIILTALPGALAGIVWMLYLTGTTVSVPALMGAIMCIGVATSNSILLVTFANDERREGTDARGAALTAGATRLRPVLMTALAMVIGMLPMSLGVGEGGEQNAPLGRAVIGGLLVATAYTLVFVPLMYSLLRRQPPRPEVTDDDAEPGPVPAVAGGQSGGPETRVRQAEVRT